MVPSPLAGLTAAAPLRSVDYYVWRDPDDPDKIAAVVPALDWWDGAKMADPNGSKTTYIVVKPAYAEYCEPDEVILSCGHWVPIKQRRGRKWYNLRRRCILCATSPA